MTYKGKASLGLISNYCFVMFYAKALACVENLRDVLPMFNNMICLRVINRGNLVGRTFMDLLRSLPVLETLIFEKGISHWAEDEFVQEMLPPCILYRLKVVRFQIFSREEHELNLMKFLLKNAMDLEEMIVTADDKLPRGPTMEEVKKLLLTCPKGSNGATIVFS